MRRRISKEQLVASVVGLLMLLASATHADAIQPSFTVTDLGSVGQGNGPSLDPSRGVVIAADGHTTYPFPQMGTGVQEPDPATLPVPYSASRFLDTNAIVTSQADDASALADGTVIAIDQVVHVLGTGPWEDYIPYYVQKNPDGTWGVPVALGQGYFNSGPPNGFPFAGNYVNYWLDKAGDVLVQTQDTFVWHKLDATLYNIKANSSISIATLPSMLNTNYDFQRVVAMDDDGQILVQALAPTPSGGDEPIDLLLLTPAGVSSDPINTPEPGSLAVMAMAMAAFAVYRARGRKAAG